MCVVFFCVQIMYISLYFSASESAPERRETVRYNNTYNRRPFFCVLSALMSLNDKIYIQRCKASKKYLKIAYFGMQYYCCVLCHGVPPPRRSQQHTLPLLKIFIFLFLFFYFSAWIFDWYSRNRCAYFVFVLVGGGAADGLTEIIKHGV